MYARMIFNLRQPAVMTMTTLSNYQIRLIDLLHELELEIVRLEDAGKITELVERLYDATVGPRNNGKGI